MTVLDKMKVITVNSITRLATEEEYIRIEKIKREVLTEMNIKNEALLYNKYYNCVQDFYIKVNNKNC